MGALTSRERACPERSRRVQQDVGALAIAFAVLQRATGSSVVATLEINHRFQTGQLLQNALQGDSDLMRRLIELYRRANPHVHAHDFALNRDVRMFVRESELQLRSGQQKTAGFNVPA